MYNLIMFLPRCFFYVVSLGGWNWFPKNRTALLPERIFYAKVAPAFGVDMKPLIKGIEAALGKDLEENLTDVGGFKPGRIFGNRDPSYTDGESFVKYCQGDVGAIDMGFFIRQPQMHMTSLLVSEECLIKILASKCFVVYTHEDYTSSVYEGYTSWKDSKFIGAATEFLIASGDLEKECFECEWDGGIDEDGDCKNCNTERVSEELLNNTIKKLQKEAA